MKITDIISIIYSIFSIIFSIINKFSCFKIKVVWKALPLANTMADEAIPISYYTLFIWLLNELSYILTAFI